MGRDGASCGQPERISTRFLGVRYPLAPYVFSGVSPLVLALKDFGTGGEVQEPLNNSFRGRS